MEIRLRNTDKIVQINGVPARLWEGTTAAGTRVLAFVTRLAVPEGDDASVFERELIETPPMAPVLGRDFNERLVL